MPKDVSTKAYMNFNVDLFLNLNGYYGFRRSLFHGRVVPFLYFNYVFLLLLLVNSPLLSMGNVLVSEAYINKFF